VNKKDECNRNIRDLGVLPEEAFDKYINEKSDRVSLTSIAMLSLQRLSVAGQKTAHRE
jgi:hypothetical protein